MGKVIIELELKDRVKKIRKDANLTQQAFAQSIGTNQNTVTHYETGRTKLSGISAKIICDQYGVNIDWLLKGTGEPYCKPPENNMVAMAAQLLGKHDPIFEAFIETYSKLTPANKEAVINFGLELLNSIDEHSKKE